ncbi:hypothetical protein ACTHAL_000535 [Priestia flexa]|nr:MULTISPECIES: hypothetical protein [Priestia]
MEWSVGHSTPAGKRGKTEIPRKASDRSVMERTCSDKPKRWEQLVFVS